MTETVPIPEPAASTEPLTERQLQVLALVAAGHPTAAIADELGVGEATVKTHLTTIYRKMAVSNRVQAALQYHARYAP